MFQDVPQHVRSVQVHVNAGGGRRSQKRGHPVHNELITTRTSYGKGVKLVYPRRLTLRERDAVTVNETGETGRERETSGGKTRGNKDGTRVYVCVSVVGRKRNVVERSLGAVNTYQCPAEFQRAFFHRGTP